MRSIITIEEREPVNSKIYQYLLCLFVITNKDFNFISRNIEEAELWLEKLKTPSLTANRIISETVLLLIKMILLSPPFHHHLSVLPITTNLPRHSSGISIQPLPYPDNVRPWKDHFYIIENSDRPFSTGSPVRGRRELELVPAHLESLQ